MQLLRYNPFNQIHKALRALLYDTALQIQRVDFSDDDATEIVLENVELVILLFEGHAHVEDTMVFPLIKDTAPSIVASFEAQHEEDHSLAELLSHSVKCCRKAARLDEKLFAGRGLLLAFNDFLAFNVKHMNEEETLVNGYLWKYFSDEELMEHTKKIAAAIPPEKNMHYSKWMLKGLNNHEIFIWYSAIKHTAPAVVFNMFCDMAEKELETSKWGTIKDVLQEGMLV